MTKIQELESTRDRTAGQVAELQRALDELSGAEELITVQRMLAELDALQRLLAAQDRQLSVQYAAQQEQARAEREQRRVVAAKEAAAIDAEVRRALLGIRDLVEKRGDVTAEFSDLARSSGAMRTKMVDLLSAVGVGFQTHGLGLGISPIRR